MARYGSMVPEGTRDLMFKECDALRDVENHLTKLFKSRGFNEVITPSLEFYDVFDGKAKTMPSEMMYKLIDSKGRILVMRPDNTMPVVRVASTKLKDFEPPLRLYYNQNAFRVSPALSGRSDEIPQCGIELLGVNGIKADLEVIVTAIESLKTISDDFRFEIGHVGFYKSLIEELKCDDDKKEIIRKYIEAKNYAALSDILSDSAKEDKASSALLKLPRLFGGEEIINQALDVAPNVKAVETINYLRSIYEILCNMGYKDNIMIDLGLIQQIEYYTGVAFRGYMQGSGDYVLSGGRYDGLSESFGKSLSATGFGINTVLASRYGDINKTSSKPDVILFYELNSIKQAFAYIKELSKSSIISEISDFDTLEQTINYAKIKGISRVDTIDENGEVKSLNIKEAK